MFSAFIYLLRCLKIGFVLAREGALSLIDPNIVPPLAGFLLKCVRFVEKRHPDSENLRLSRAMIRLGPSYVKFGQFLATRPDIIGTEASQDLQSLQDRMPPFSQVEAIKILENNVGKPLLDLFSDFGPPVAAASIAQVHKARLKHNQLYVAVKILRPHVRTRFQHDLQTMRFLARIVERIAPQSLRLRPLEIVETLARSVALEMDLRLEAAALSELADNSKIRPDFYVPSVEWDLTGRDVLTTEWIDGIALNNLEGIDQKGHDRVRLGRLVIQSFLEQAIHDGFFHADMHQGNLFVDSNDRLVAVDGGIMGRLGLKERRFLAEILLGFITRNYRRVAEVHFEAGYVPLTHSIDDFAQAIRAIGEPIHSRKADEISMAKLLTLLFEITGLFDMETRPELVMLQKTMVVVEGVARSLDPKLDMWRTAEPVVRRWIEEQLGPKARLMEAGENISQALMSFRRLPVILESLEEKLHSVSPVKQARSALLKRSLWNMVPLWMIVILLFWLVVKI